MDEVKKLTLEALDGGESAEASGSIRMKIHIKSNFIVPGLEDKESVDCDSSNMTLRQFLEELSRKAPTPIQYVRSGADALDPDDWEVEVNGIFYKDCRDGLEAQLEDGDTVTIKILASGGG